MIKVDLITGFLGSGKSTFLKKYASYLIGKGEHICILENDFGAVNVDMLLMQDLLGDHCDLEMVAGGCDKDCHKRRFKTKLISMGMRGFDRVLIEPSGIFDVDEFFDTLREEPLDQWYEIGNVIAVVVRNCRMKCLKTPIICWLPRLRARVLSYSARCRKPRSRRSKGQRHISGVPCSGSNATDSLQM